MSADHAPHIRDGLRLLRRLSWPMKRLAVVNWWHGYRFGPVRRCRFCDRTTPYHYPTCRVAQEEHSG